MDRAISASGARAPRPAAAGGTLTGRVKRGAIAAAARLRDGLRHRLDLAAARAAWRAGRGPRPIMLLLASDGLAYTSEQQFAPFARFRGELRRELGLVVRRTRLRAGEAPAPRLLARADIVGLKLAFTTPAELAGRSARLIRERLPAGARLVYFDGDDDSAVQWPDVLDAVDLYVKKHLFADLAAYARAYLGKSNLTDHVARQHGRSFADNIIPGTAPLRPEAMAKLHLGWSIALDDKIADLAAAAPPPGAAERPVDVCSRAVVSPDAWIHPLRAPVVEALETMGRDLAVLVPRNRVGQEDYYAEMRSARICVSPFGYGELCWRDFEAVLMGCLLVKPDMAHIRTAPDLFRAGETYLPCAWDFADLDTVCRAALDDPAGRARIVAEARRTLADSLTPGWFVGRVQAMLDRLAAPMEGARPDRGPAPHEPSSR